ncbi:cold-shock protein [Amycolatopsis sp. cg5]|uniref:cold-shock protein n=1 Tax=Amycolatopsis sp. cg5 TaxID=3238802 RepID=UPI00352652B0
MSAVVTGKILRFDDVRGYGFVAPDEGTEDVFIHVNDLEFDKRLIAPGVRVRFATEESVRGLKASRVHLAEATSEPEVRPAVEPVVGAEYDDVACDVLSADEFREEITEALLSGVPSLTGEQIVAVRRSVAALAGKHGWLDD